DSDQLSQNDYRQEVRKRITDVWQGSPSTDGEIRVAIDSTIDFQIAVGCSQIILPSTLTIDPGTSYEKELKWLDIGLDQARKAAPRVRALATVALSDICTFSAEPKTNR